MRTVYTGLGNPSTRDREHSNCSLGCLQGPSYLPSGPLVSKPEKHLFGIQCQPFVLSLGKPQINEPHNICSVLDMNTKSDFKDLRTNPGFSTHQLPSFPKGQHVRACRLSTPLPCHEDYRCYKTKKQKQAHLVIFEMVHTFKH